MSPHRRTFIRFRPMLVYVISKILHGTILILSSWPCSVTPRFTLFSIVFALISISAVFPLGSLTLGHS